VGHKTLQPKVGGLAIFPDPVSLFEAGGVADGDKRKYSLLGC